MSNFVFIYLSFIQLLVPLLTSNGQNSILKIKIVCYLNTDESWLCIGPVLELSVSFCLGLCLELVVLTIEGVFWYQFRANCGNCFQPRVTVRCRLVLLAKS